MTLSTPSRISFRFFVRRHSNVSTRGFTLIELLLALALTVTVVALLTSAMFTAFRAKTSINNALDIVRAGDPAALIVQELANALPPTQTGSTTTLTVTGLGPSAIAPEATTLQGPFLGYADEIDFFTSGPEPKADLQPDVRHVQYALVAEANGVQSLVRRVSTNLLISGDAEFDPDEVICTNVRSFTVQYFDGVTAFEPTWDSTAKNNLLPFAIQFTLEFNARPGEEKPRIITRYVPIPCAQAIDSTTQVTPTTGATP